MPVGVVIGLGSAALTAVITEVYAHRCLAHHAFRVSPRLALFFETYFRVIVGTDPETWAAVHRLHHRFADEPQDPHSPVLRAPITVLLGSPFLFASARKLVPPGAPRGREHIAIRILLAAVFFVMVGVAQLVTMVAVHLVCYMGIMGMVNTVGHLYGRKPHPAAAGYDAAWLAIPLLGHGYHNSHHAHPASPRTGRLDPIWPVLHLLVALRMVKLEERGAHSPAGKCCVASTALAGRS